MLSALHGASHREEHGVHACSAARVGVRVEWGGLRGHGTVNGTVHGTVHGMAHGMAHGTMHGMHGTVHGTAHGTRRTVQGVEDGARCVGVVEARDERIELILLRAAHDLTPVDVVAHVVEILVPAGCGGVRGVRGARGVRGVRAVRA